MALTNTQNEAPPALAAEHAEVEQQQVELPPSQSGSNDVEVKVDGGIPEFLDPTHPLNWSTAKKFYNMGVPSLLCFVVYVVFVLFEELLLIEIVLLEARYTRPPFQRL